MSLFVVGLSSVRSLQVVAVFVQTVILAVLFADRIITVPHLMHLQASVALSLSPYLQLLLLH